MNIWILTIGSSDVQFTADDDKWNRLYRKVRSRINTSHKFSPTPRPNDDTGEAFLVPARVMGMVYEEQLEENYADLYFPLLDAFSQKLQGENTPNRIMVILTDQEQVFTAQEQKERNCPYWQDTCKLKPIIEKYLKNNFPNATIEEPIYLKPQSKEQGLDNWDKALGLVTKELSKKEADANDNIYVSHQAGTPAISSAVQFMSLARFGERVKFLVSNEYEKKPLEPIKSEEYLRGIKFQEAKTLLERHDYSGVKELLFSYLNPETKDLLDAAIQWNFAKFEDFAEAMIEAAAKHSKDNEWWKTIDSVVKARSKEWWWTAYESAYLAVVRLEQENTVEAMFHSFRAVEGLLRKWADETHPPKEGQNPKHIQILCDGRTKTFNRYGKALYNCLDKDYHNKHNCNIDSIQNEDIWKFGNVTFDKRNDLFHQLLGMQKVQVFEDWDTHPKNQEAWEARVLGCLNFISGESFTPSLKETSLMSKVHEELDKAIASYL